MMKDAEVLKYAQIVVSRFIAKGAIPPKEKDDISMTVVEKFLSKREKIDAAYKGNSKYSTYCIAVLNKMCLEVIRKDIKYWDIREFEEYKSQQEFDLSSQNKLIIKDEIRYLNKILILFGREKYKLILFLAFYFKSRIIDKDVFNYHPGLINSELKDTFKQNQTLSKAELFESLAKVVNFVENKEVKADAVRMWLNKKRDLIIKRLNSTSYRTNYDKDSFQTLFELLYEERKIGEEKGLKN